MVEPRAAAAAEATVHVEAGVEYELEYQRFAPEPLCLYVPHSYLHTHRARELSSDNEFWAAMAAAPHSDLCPVRADAAEMSKDQFNERFCRPDPAHGNLLPALVSGLTDAWPAREAWQIDALRRSHGEALFAVAGGRVTLANYLRHATSSAADWPFYVFDDDFSGAKSSLLEDYRPHDYFDDVLCLPAGDRPSPRYFLLGPRASGTCMHQDPMATSAWNTLLAGRCVRTTIAHRSRLRSLTTCCGQETLVSVSAARGHFRYQPKHQNRVSQRCISRRGCSSASRRGYSSRRQHNQLGWSGRCNTGMHTWFSCQLGSDCVGAGRLWNTPAAARGNIATGHAQRRCSSGPHPRLPR